MQVAVSFVAAVAALLSSAAFAGECPDIGAAPRTDNLRASEFAQSGNYSLDEDGILLFDYGSAYNNLGKFQNPYYISKYAHLLYQDFLAYRCADEEVRQKFILQAEWFIENMDWQNGAAVWRYPFEAQAFDLKPGWISGIGQARIAGVLQRAFALTGEIKYREVAEAAMKVYNMSPADGGVAIVEGDVTWTEEAANTNGQSYKILNGHITALAGILDLARITEEEEWQELYYRALAAVRRDIAKFDAGFLSYYSLASPRIRQMAARRDYNSLHVHQLLWLFEETGDPLFLEWASRFQAYEMNSDIYSAKGSVDPEGHGPDQAAGYYGNHYWSHAKFPTWIQVDVGEPEYFKGIAVHGGGQKATPRDFSISARIDGEWRVVAKERGNTDMRRVVKFTYPVLADAFRVDIYTDNGNKNVALQAVMPMRSEPQFAPITNECNYRAMAENNNYDLALDGDPDQSMSVLCPGWVILPTNGNSKLTVHAIGSSGAKLRIEVSDDLHQWRASGDTGLHGRVTIPSAKFVRVSFGKTVRRIDQLTISEE